jgi:thiamine-phosphate pyrophosphorylase
MADGYQKHSDPRTWGLYLVTDRRQTSGRDLVQVVKEAVAGGVRAIQLREKDLETAELYRLAEWLLRVARDGGAALLINDRVDVAMALSADGVHLGRKSLPPKEVRDLVGAGMLIGVSCHGVEDVHEAVEAGADFAVLGPIYATPSKTSYGPPLSPAILSESRRSCPLPLLAIGGIKPARVPEVVSAGADGVAAISAILSAAEPGAAARGMLDAVTRAARVR